MNIVKFTDFVFPAEKFAMLAQQQRDAPCTFIREAPDMSKFGRRIKQAPEGYDYIEPTLTALENELRESK